MRWWSCLLGVFGTLVLSYSSPVLASTKLALVIGNGAYANVSPLTNPANDARGIADVLEELGFEVARQTDLAQLELIRALQDFQRRSLNADVALIYYAGHGIEVDRRNYLIPIDAELKTDRDINFQAVPLALAVQAADGAQRLSLVIVDACRNNPFLREMTRTTRSIGRGLAAIEPEGNTLVAYAAKEGTLALDGEGQNSPYAQALIETLREPGVEVGKVFRKVRDRVLAATDGKQEPFLYGSISAEDFYLNAPVPTGVADQPTPTVQPDRELEATYWRLCEVRDTLAYCQAYLEAYPDGPRAPLAQIRVNELEIAAAPRPTTPSPMLPQPTDPKPEAALPAMPGEAIPEPSARESEPLREPDPPLATLSPAETEPRNNEQHLVDEEQLAMQREADSAWPALKDSWDMRAIRAFEVRYPEARQVVEAEERIAFLRDRYREAQAGLNRLGYDAGPVDGAWGPRSARAMRAFQSDSGLARDGVVSKATLSLLKTAAPRAATPVAPTTTTEREAEPDSTPEVAIAPPADQDSIADGSRWIASGKSRDGTLIKATVTRRGDTLMVVMNVDLRGTATFGLQFADQYTQRCTVSAANRAVECWISGRASHTPGAKIYGVFPRLTYQMRAIGHSNNVMPGDVVMDFHPVP